MVDHFDTAAGIAHHVIKEFSMNVSLQAVSHCLYEAEFHALFSCHQIPHQQEEPKS